MGNGFIPPLPFCPWIQILSSYLVILKSVIQRAAIIL